MEEMHYFKESQREEIPVPDFKDKASPHNCVCGLRPIFCPIRAAIKGGNTYSIPALL